MLYIAQNTDARLRDLAEALDVTERTAYGVVVDLTEAGYVVKRKDGRRNRYHIREHFPLPDSVGRAATLTLLILLPLPVFVAVKQPVAWTITGTGIAVTIDRAVRTARRAGFVADGPPASRLDAHA